jgi:hypothetical protein
VDRPVLRCSFCGKKQGEVRLVAGPRGVYICNLCIALCNEILAHDTPPNTPLPPEPADRRTDPEPPGRPLEPGGWVRTVISS